jgi:hypothetical protein
MAETIALSDCLASALAAVNLSAIALSAMAHPNNRHLPKGDQEMLGRAIFRPADELTEADRNRVHKIGKVFLARELSA